MEDDGGLSSRLRSVGGSNLISGSQKRGLAGLEGVEGHFHSRRGNTFKSTADQTELTRNLFCLLTKTLSRVVRYKLLGLLYFSSFADAKAGDYMAVWDHNKMIIRDVTRGEVVLLDSCCYDKHDSHPLAWAHWQTTLAQTLRLLIWWDVLFIFFKQARKTEVYLLDWTRSFHRLTQTPVYRSVCVPAPMLKSLPHNLQIYQSRWIVSGAKILAAAPLLTLEPVEFPEFPKFLPSCFHLLRRFILAPRCCRRFSRLWWCQVISGSLHFTGAGETSQPPSD